VISLYLYGVVLIAVLFWEGLRSWLHCKGFHALFSHMLFGRATFNICSRSTASSLLLLENIPTRSRNL
jgi:hypothetical protein